MSPPFFPPPLVMASALWVESTSKRSAVSSGLPLNWAIEPSTFSASQHLAVLVVVEIQLTFAFVINSVSNVKSMIDIPINISMANKKHDNTFTV